MRKIPPLNSLRAFEAAARLQSYTLAANELSVTQGAVSKQIKVLENHLGARLFTREFQGVSLTNKGREYFNAIEHVFNDIALATETIGNNIKDSVIRLNALPTLSQRWLMPRLAKFHEANPSIRIELASGDGDVNFNGNEISNGTPYDIAIRAIHQSQSSIVPSNALATLLMTEELLPVCSPAYLRKINSNFGDSTNLCNMILLQHSTRPNMWAEYMSQTNMSDEKQNKPTTEHSMVFEHFFMLIEATINGQGVALIPKFLVEKELKDKTLTSPITNEFSSPYEYYFIYRSDLKHSLSIQTFLHYFTGL